MEYKIITGYNTVELEAGVTKAMEQGWTVSGNLVVTVFNDNSILMCQPMIHA